ncbi:hypothetical protein [Streptomyces humi]
MPTVVSVNVMHQKIVVIDEQTVLLGSLNSLSQSHSREVMLTIKVATSPARSSPTSFLAQKCLIAGASRLHG